LLVDNTVSQFLSPVLTGNLTFTARTRLLPCIIGKAHLRRELALPGRNANGENASDPDIRNDLAHLMRKERSRLYQSGAAFVKRWFHRDPATEVP